MEITVKAKYVRSTPRKLRLVADLVRGWEAQRALNQLRFIPKAATRDLAKVIQSALAAAKTANLDPDKIYISELRIDDGPRLKRRVMMSRGRANPIQKQQSHVTIKLAEKTVPAEPQPAETKPTETNNQADIKETGE